MEHLLFSYGTLQLEKVQLETYGRLLHGITDKLIGFKIGNLEITDQKVIETSGKKFHPIAISTNNLEDFIDGHVFKITAEELAFTDQYEVGDYTRVRVALVSGKIAWVYVKEI